MTLNCVAFTKLLQCCNKRRSDFICFLSMTDLPSSLFSIHLAPRSYAEKNGKIWYCRRKTMHILYEYTQRWLSRYLSCVRCTYTVEFIQLGIPRVQRSTCKRLFEVETATEHADNLKSSQAPADRGFSTISCRINGLSILQSSLQLVVQTSNKTNNAISRRVYENAAPLGCVVCLTGLHRSHNFIFNPYSVFSSCFIH